MRILAFALGGVSEESLSDFKKAFEKKIAEDANSSFVNKAGYDEINPEKGRIETKFTNYILANINIIIFTFSVDWKNSHFLIYFSL